MTTWALLASACGPSLGAVAPPTSGPFPTPDAIPIAPALSSPAPTSTLPIPPASLPPPSPTPGPTLDNPLIIKESDWTRGPLTASVVFIEYADFQCERCAEMAAIVTRLQSAHPGQVLHVFRQFPLLGLNDKALIAAEAAEAAGAQGRFWEMHDLLYERQGEWAPLAPEAFAGRLAGWASEIGLEVPTFVADLNAGAYRDKVLADYNAALALGVPGAPTLVLNGEVYAGPLDFDLLDAVVRLQLLARRQFSAAPELAINIGRQYQAELHTSRGEIVITLFPDRAPTTVNNFIFLARQGWFDGVTFHRVVAGQLAQTGDPSGTGYGGPGYTIPDELDNGLTFDGPGVVAMANAGPATGGSQFFITLRALPHLNGKYTIFGRVTTGLDIVAALDPRDPSDPNAPPGEIIHSVTITER